MNAFIKSFKFIIHQSNQVRKKKQHLLMIIFQTFLKLLI
jgi:hypothetical protein